MTDPQQFLIYQSEDGSTRINVMLEAETLWLNQKQLTELFGKVKGTISEHIKHIFEDGELDENSVVRFFRTTATDGKQYEVAHYNLGYDHGSGFPGVQPDRSRRSDELSQPAPLAFDTRTGDTP